MLELSLTLSTVTPLFLGGADPRGAPELRAPSFRGAMRYWMRALVGAAGEPLMHQLEKHLFGEGGNEAAAGAVSLHLAPPANLRLETYTKVVNKQLGIAYLWFAARGTKAETERSAIMPVTFTFKLSAPRSKQPEQDLNRAVAVLWLLTRLGGIGARSRRFAGGVQVSDVMSAHDADNIVTRLPVRAGSAKELAEEIAEGIQAARRAFDIQQLVAPAPHLFDVLHPERCQIFVLNRTFDSWDQAVEKVGQTYQAFRQLRQPDYNVVKRAMTNSQDLSGTVERAAFGLPIPFFYRSLNNRTTTLQAEGDDTIDRRASPLWMRAVKLNDGKYVVVFTWFKSQFLPNGAKFLLTERKQANLHGKQLPNDHLISMFLQGSDTRNQSSLKDAGYSVLEVKW